RTRGDRPYLYRVRRRIAPVPPHARRSTPSSGESLTVQLGSSARAEIDLRRSGYCGRNAGFLRTRGDRPLSPGSKSVSPAVPPHARRSTPGDGAEEPTDSGSSARAEIDPFRAFSVSVSCGFLRTRGDRPS